MIRIEQLRLPPDHSERDLIQAISDVLWLGRNVQFSYEIMRRAIDARKKPDLYYVYIIDVECAGEARILKKNKKKTISRVQRQNYSFPPAGTQQLRYPPVIVGTGPAGLFCGLMLARAGYRPILLERGEKVEDRMKTVQSFWDGNALHPNSNVQFGEGGAGTFSDGKLNTSVKDPKGRIRFVLKTFIQAGADEDILYDYKPHIGTDILMRVVKNIREEIQGLGGQILFQSQLTDYKEETDGSYTLSVQKTDRCDGDSFHIKTEILVLAIGHSARDTFHMLKAHNLPMTAKAFAVGVRVEHPQKLMDDNMYGPDCPYELPSAPYKVTHQLPDGRGVYSFCMCPGGYVVNASSEPGRLAVNGMSYHNRDSGNANSAIVVTVSPEDYGGEDALSGISYQQKLEEKAYQAGKGSIPVQRLEDFRQNRASETIGKWEPKIKGSWQPANVRDIFEPKISRAIEDGILAFDRKIKGFADPDALLSGVESRTSSPVRILRGETCESESKGIYPCGEGAGYAGGITSAAVDGIRVAESIATKYKPL